MSDGAGSIREIGCVEMEKRRETKTKARVLLLLNDHLYIAGFELLLLLNLIVFVVKDEETLLGIPHYYSLRINNKKYNH